MLLSVDNFKSIAKTRNIKVAPMTVLAGVNSSGKSSLIQVLLLLKQTVSSSGSEKLNINGPYVYANSLLDLVHNKRNDIMSFKIVLSGNEILNKDDFKSVMPSVTVGTITLNVGFKVRQDETSVEEFGLTISDEHDAGQMSLSIKRRPRKGTYNLSYGISGNGDCFEEKDLTLDTYSFASFFPVFFKDQNKRVAELPVVKIAHETLRLYFERLVFIAPQRVAPVLSRTYLTDVETRYVLPDGENARFIIDRLIENPDNEKLFKEWVCDKFKLAKDFAIVKEPGKRYRAIVTTNEGLKVDLIHMGFGLSQVLPVITQGCISRPGSVLVVEDPDVHMHPSIQAAMADFFIYLSCQRKVTVMIETHSDHFITRLRRRIAEKVISPDMIHLIFVEYVAGESVYKTIGLAASGRLEGSLPPGFMDSLDEDFRAILRASRQ